ncbi:MAG TPA: SUF system NifU family Fe-S cluster assembly protein [Limnochordia bacterium]
MGLEDLYREVIMDHYRHPRNRGRLDHPAVSIELNNPTCGDEIELDLALAEERVVDARFSGRGCSISQASASMMTEAIKGKSLDEALALIERFRALMRGGSPVDGELGDIEALSGVAKFPVRVKCATLSWEALAKGIEKYRNAKSDKGDARSPAP